MPALELTMPNLGVTATADRAKFTSKLWAAGNEPPLLQDRFAIGVFHTASAPVHNGFEKSMSADK